MWPYRTQHDLERPFVVLNGLILSCMVFYEKGIKIIQCSENYMCFNKTSPKPHVYVSSHKNQINKMSRI